MTTMPVPVTVEYRRTPLGGAAETPIVEQPGVGHGVIQRVSARRTQSIGSQQGTVQLRNEGARFNNVASGDLIRLRARSPRDGAWYVLLEGFVGEPQGLHEQHPTMLLPIHGGNEILNLVKVTTAKTYTGTVYAGNPSIVRDVATTYLPGVTLSIDADAAAPTSWEVLAGETVAQVLGKLRKAVQDATGADWEFRLDFADGVKTLHFVKRLSTVQRELTLRDLLTGSRLVQGSVLDVVNKAQVLGASVPTKRVDKTGLTKDGAYKLDATTKRIAVPFTAEDTPLSAVQLVGDRSTNQNPPTLKANVARNSDNRDILTQGPLRGASVLRSLAGITGLANVNDGDYSNTNSLGVTQAAHAGDGNWYEIAAYDLGAGPPGIHAVLSRAAVGGTGVWEVQHSDDDSTYTSLAFNPNGSRMDYLASVETHRYWRIRHKSNDANFSDTFQELGLLETQNLSTDVTNPKNTHDAGLLGGTSDVSTTGGGQVKEIDRRNYRSAKRVAKSTITHSTASPDGNHVLVLQKSTDGAAWSDVAIVPTVNGSTTHTVYPEDAATQYWRWIVRDDRAGGSPSVTVSTTEVQFVLHTGTFSKPLTGDKMVGGEVSWVVEGLVARPGALEKRSYTAPRHALVTGEKYWLLLEVTSGSSASWWELDYGTEAGAEDTIVSTDSGTTWTSLATDAVLKHLLEFNNRQLEGTSDDAASQTKYASLFPSGIIAGAELDETYRTQSMVDRAAGIMTRRRGDVRERGEFRILFDPSIVEGKRVSLTREGVVHLGGSVVGSALTKEYDVVEVSHDLPLGVSVVFVGEHPPSGEDALGYVAGQATGRRV